MPRPHGLPPAFCLPACLPARLLLARLPDRSSPQHSPHTQHHRGLHQRAPPPPLLRDRPPAAAPPASLAAPPGAAAPGSRLPAPGSLAPSSCHLPVSSQRRAPPAADATLRGQPAAAVVCCPWPARHDGPLAGPSCRPVAACRQFGKAGRPAGLSDAMRDQAALGNRAVCRLCWQPLLHHCARPAPEQGTR